MAGKERIKLTLQNMSTVVESNEPCLQGSSPLSLSSLFSLETSTATVKAFVGGIALTRLTRYFSFLFCFVSYFCVSFLLQEILFSVVVSFVVRIYFSTNLV
jgi:hypothetical protein